MGILDFLKKTKSEKISEKNKLEDKKQNNIEINLEQGEIVVFDEFGKEKKVNRGKWINDVLNERIKENWNNPELLSTIILDAFSKKVYPETREACLQLYSIDGNDERKINILGTYYTKIGKHNEAVEMYENYLFRNEGTEAIFLNYANILEQLGKWEEVEKKYLEALKLNPNSKRSFNKYFKLLKGKNKEKYYKNLGELSVLDGMWRAKLLTAVNFFENGDRENGEIYLEKSLEESGYADDAMGFASALYLMNGFYDKFQKNILTKFHPEKHGVYTILNVMEYYRITGNYSKGLELSKFVSKFNFDKFFDKFLEYENNFLKLKRKMDNESHNNDYMLLDKPLWYNELKESKWLLKNNNKKYNMLILPFVSIEEDTMDRDENSKKLSYGIPLYINELIQVNGEIESSLFVQMKKDKLIIPKDRYSREYMYLIKSQNNQLNFILSGNISRIKSGHNETSSDYNVEIYLFNFEEESKISLVNNIYSEKNLYEVINELIFQLNGFFMLDMKSIYDKDNENLFLYEKKLVKRVETENIKNYNSWEYKKMLGNQIDILLSDMNNEIKKINLIALIYEISKTNSQLLKGVKPIIYKMIESNFFSEYNLKLLIPVIFNIYNDEKNYNKYIEELREEIKKNNHLEYGDWLNQFLNYNE